jgi:hypothetical protein
MGLYEFFFSSEHTRLRDLEGKVAALQTNNADVHVTRERLRREWMEKNNPKPKSDIAAKVASLEHEVSTANLVIEALLEELESRGGISRDSLAKRMHEIDARDGKVDGRKST